MLSAKHNVGKSDRSSKVGQLRPVYRLLLALIAVPILPRYAPIDDALAGAGTEHRSSANPGWLSHDGAILGRRNTMREKLITATKPTSQNSYRANPTGNELGTEPAANSVACASTWSRPQIKTSHN